MNYDEAMAKVQTEIGDVCKVTKVDTAPYGWMFHYAKDLAAYWEKWIDWEDPSIIGGGPIFIDIFGEMFSVPGFPPTEDFYDNWEAAHPEYEWSETENAVFDCGTPLVRGQNKNDEQSRVINTILMYAIKDKATEICVESLSNFFGYRLMYCVDGKWRDQWKSPYYALLAQRIKQMAEIPARDKNHLNETQSGTIKVTMQGKNYSFYVTATIVESCEQINLRLEAK